MPAIPAPTSSTRTIAAATSPSSRRASSALRGELTPRRYGCSVRHEGLDGEPGPEDEEQRGRPETDRPRGQPPPEGTSHEDREAVRDDHADGGAEPHPGDAPGPGVLGGEGDGGEHRLVAELGEEERDAGGQDRRPRGGLRLVLLGLG